MGLVLDRTEGLSTFREMVRKMNCPKCQAENPADASFCAECGERLATEESERTATLVQEGAETDHLGPYELRGELGRGAMARVWRAWDPNLEREVAIKEPLFDSNLSEATLEEMGRRFVKEGKAAARLNHPNIVTLHTADVYDGRPAIVMELVDGTTLSGLLDKGKLSPEEALSVLDQLLDAVGYAHENNVVHRDIKPDNIFVSSRGDVKLADFGIAHVADSGATRATMVGTVLGTPGYMSPEQATGKAVDARSDIFSIGTVAYEMLTGRNPFGAEDGSDATTLLYRIVHEPAPELPENASEGLPADLRPAIMAALAKDPQDRPQTASEFKAMLHGRKKAPIVSKKTQVLADAVEGKRGKLPKWTPYAAVAAVAAVVLIGAFTAANSGTSSGMGGTGSVAETQANAVNSYLAPSGEYVAIYASNNPNTPYQVTRLKVNDLSPEVAAELGSHNTFASVEEATAKVDEWQKAIDDAAAAEKAKEEEQKKKEEEEAAKKVAEVNEVTLTCVGADGTTRSETIRRKGNTERVIPDSNTRSISDDEINALSNAERCIAYNEIIASANGYSFKNSGLSAYFNDNCKSWYVSLGGSGGTEGLSAEAQDNVNRLKNATDGWWKNLATY